MQNSDWLQIEDIFHAAATLPAEARAEFLTNACRSNESIREEVESLLAASDGLNGFMQGSALSLGFRVMYQDGGSLAGRAVGPYQVLTLLGRGGMGEVYLGEDPRLERKVALKFLSKEFVGDNWAKHQLIKEAQAVAILDHPNICPVYGIEQGHGHSFIVMQYVEGETLSDLIRNHPLTEGELITLARQIAGAITEAHAHGIIHRDIKPKNIMVTPSGQVKVLDFGLAKLVRQRKGELRDDSVSQLTQNGILAGTVAYMSPEQLRGEKLDFRSDIFSLGTVLYEMTEGRNPFARNSDAETISEILTSTPVPPKRLTGELSTGVGAIALKCLKKEKDQRYQSVSELLEDLDRLELPKSKKRSWPRISLKVIAACLALVVLVASAFMYWRMNRVFTVAVLPISNESADPALDYLEDGFTDSLIGKLSQLSRLRVNAFSTVSGYRGKSADPGQIGRRLNVDAVLAGRISRQGNEIILEVNLISTSGGLAMSVDRYDIGSVAISQIQEKIAQRVADNLELKLEAGEKELLAAPETKNENAFQEYLRGRFFWQNRNRENIQKAIDKFKAAIALDPAYARAYAGLADCYVLMNTTAYGDMPTSEAMNRARAAAKQALLIDNNLPEAHTSLGIVSLKYDWNWQEAETHFKQAIRLNPDYAPAHYWHSNLLTITGRQAEALAESERAKTLDPFSLSTRMNYCREYYYGREYEKAAGCFEAMLKEEPGNSGAQHVLGYVYLQMGQSAKAIEMFNKLPDTNRSLKAVALAYYYGRTGNKAEALRLLSETQQLAKDGYVSPFEFAVIYLGLGDKENLFFWLEQAYKERSASIIALKVEPAFDTLRTDPRFVDLLARMKLDAL